MSIVKTPSGISLPTDVLCTVCARLIPRSEATFGPQHRGANPYMCNRHLKDGARLIRVLTDYHLEKLNGYAPEIGRLSRRSQKVLGHG